MRRSPRTQLFGIEAWAFHIAVFPFRCDSQSWRRLTLQTKKLSDATLMRELRSFGSRKSEDQRGNPTAKRAVLEQRVCRNMTAELEQTGPYHVSRFFAKRCVGGRVQQSSRT